MIRFVYRVAMLAFAVLLSTGTASAATSSSLAVTVPQLAKAPAVNGVIDASWNGAVRVNLGYDYIYHRPAAEATTVYIAQSGHALFIAYDVHQRETLTVGQTTNGGAVLNDDHVALALYPQGAHGFSYIFRSNVNGARDQSSSENSSYAPQWESAGHKTAYGYQVTMRIPLDVIRSGGSRSWRAQFVRITSASGSRYVWSYDPAMQYDIDVNYVGTLNGIRVPKGALRPPARFQLYGLGEAASQSAGGTTSRMGADLSVPITSTASFVATLHPDYSNVEIDQQSVAPQEFPRFYQEVRPFFTQIGSQFNGRFNCFNCAMTLYTPSIPAFSQGYAVEGAQGPATFAAFDAIGPQRTDDAQTFGLFESNRDHQGQFSVQRVSVDTPQVHDVSSTLATGYSFAHNHLLVFANAGTDRGTFVTDPSQGGYQEYGVGSVDQTSNVFLDYQHVGSQFLPVDGYVSHPGIAGLLAAGGKTFNYSPKSYVQQVSLNTFWDKYRDDGGRTNQSDQLLGVSLRTRSLLGFSIATGSSSLLMPDGEMLPFNQNSVSFSYRANTATPSSVQYAHGSYYHGFLGSWYAGTSIRLAKPLILSLEADTTHYVPGDAFGPGTAFNEIAADELLERVSLDWQFNHKASLDIGARRIAGIFAPTGFGYVPTAGTPPVDAMNLTAAFHFLALRNEFYVVYGNPNQLTTEHALFLKWIRYIGAPKGT
ncbi:MAG TPA: hypothetical protein VFN37_02720 [Candidatus Baltobacteraceae bacterium]|nr:hypothetical protein [Candidatus Baltobacteraceae bacterium]